MNIAVLINEYPPNIRSGIGRYSEMALNYINKTGGVNLSVFTTNTGHLPKFEDDGGIKVYRPMNWIQKSAMAIRKKTDSFFLSRLFLIINVFFNNFHAYGLVKKLNKSQPFDIIVIHSLVHSIAGILCGLTMNIPIVFHKHSGEFTRMPDWWRRDPLKLMELCESIMEKLSTRIIVLTQEMFDINKQHGIDANKLRIVPHGYEVALFQETNLQSAPAQAKIAELKKSLRITEDTKVILYVGRLTADKGVFNLVKAMKLLVEQHPNVRLIFVGSGQNPQLRKMIKQYGLNDIIHAYYKILDTESVLYHYAITDICISPSIFKEPFGLVALEAMSFAIPTILGDGFSRLFAVYRGKPCVYYVNGREPQDIAAKITYVLEHPAEAREIGENGRHYVENCLSWRTTAEKTLAVYTEAITAVKKFNNPQYAESIN